MKNLFYIIIAIAFILVTFFGLGPIILADGSMNERLITLLVVVLLYLLLALATFWVRKHYKGNKK